MFSVSLDYQLQFDQDAGFHQEPVNLSLPCFAKNFMRFHLGYYHDGKREFIIRFSGSCCMERVSRVKMNDAGSNE